MIRDRLAWGVVVTAVAGLIGGYTGRAQEEPAVDHAKRVIDLLDAGQFEEVAAEFNAKMAAAMPVSRLRDVWTTIGRQFGARTSILMQRVVTQATGNLTVVNACQFDRAALNVMLSFDPENKIAGMNITPRTPPAARALDAAAVERVHGGIGHRRLGVGAAGYAVDAGRADRRRDGARPRIGSGRSRRNHRTEQAVPRPGVGPGESWDCRTAVREAHTPIRRTDGGGQGPHGSRRDDRRCAPGCGAAANARSHRSQTRLRSGS